MKKNISSRKKKRVQSLPNVQPLRVVSESGSYPVAVIFFIPGKTAVVLFTQPSFSIKYIADNEWPERELVKAVCTRSIKSKPLMGEPSTGTIQTL